MPTENEMFMGVAFSFLCFTIAWGSIHQPSVRETAQESAPPAVIEMAHLDGKNTSVRRVVVPAAKAPPRVLDESEDDTRSWATALWQEAHPERR